MVIAWGLFVAEDSEALGGGYRFSSIGSGNQPDFRTISDFRKLHFAGAGRTVSADVTADLRDRNDEVGAGGTGWEQGEGQREQAQSHGLRADEGPRSDCGRKFGSC